MQKPPEGQQNRRHLFVAWEASSPVWQHRMKFSDESKANQGSEALAVCHSQPLLPDFVVRRYLWIAYRCHRESTARKTRS